MESQGWGRFRVVRFGLGWSRVGLLESNRGLELGNLPGPGRERREGVAGRGRARVVSSRSDSTKPRATLECRSRNLALSWSDFKVSL